MKLSLSVFVNLIPEIIHFVEVEFGPGNGETKLKAALDLFQAGFKEVGVPDWITSLFLGIAKVLIPKYIAKFNADPNNTLFVKSEAK